MWLLNTTTIQIQEFRDDQIPPYAILSHTWSDAEVSFQEIRGRAKYIAHRHGYRKILKCCKRAAEDSLYYVWIDTCCIDKTNSVELSEAINSMYNWYERAHLCYVYLDDMKVPQTAWQGLPHDSVMMLSNCRWFKRGWTLQELLASQNILFFNRKWQVIGTKKSLLEVIVDGTGIPASALGPRPFSTERHKFSIAQKMSWAAYRETSRVEDKAYCLLGIFGVSIPLIYGEGENAFFRLQLEIMRHSTDQSLFAWGDPQQLDQLMTLSNQAFVISFLSLKVLF
ncbi:hypothetical protein BP5796_09708 [Coleophoma crateriformis]|uniref:Uncharacterized protein n=1 Tax=Coleophoma crateriformis TaxID=565419 RepID=A0A3D8QYU5_9HELO|nr:hypothetical protein BP5796_09708 [Coleophoma crateriformis]